MQKSQLGDPNIPPSPNWEFTDIRDEIDNDTIKICTLNHCTDIITEHESITDTLNTPTCIPFPMDVDGNKEYIPPAPNITHDSGLTHSLVTNATSHITENNVVHIFQHALNHPTPIDKSFWIHIDGGANRSVTNDSSMLVSYKNIRSIPMDGVSADGPAITCTGMGFLPWGSDNKQLILVKCYYSSSVAETSISPTDIVVTKYTEFNAWCQYSNLDTGQGYIDFISRDNSNHVRFSLTSENGLWYYKSDTGTDYCINSQPIH